MESALVERPINTTAKAPKTFVVFTAYGDTQYLLAIGMLGVMGNVCMMVTILARKRWRHAANAFIFNHAFLDLAKSLYCTLLAINFIAPSIPELCTKLRVSYAYVVTTTIFNMAAMVVNELFHLRNMDVDLTVPPFALCKCILFGLFILWFGTGLLLFGVVLLGSDAFRKLKSWDQRACLLMNCELQNSDPISRMYFINTFWIIVNVAGVLITAHFLRSYYRDIRVTCYHHTLHLLSTASMTVGPVDADMLTDATKTRGVRSRLEAPAMRRLRVLTLLLVSFVVFWHPVFLLLVIDSESQGSLLIYKSANLIAWTGSTLNPIIFLFLNKRLNRCLEFPTPCFDWGFCSRRKAGAKKKMKGWTVKASSVRVPPNFSFIGQRGHQQLQSLINRRPYGNRPSHSMEPALTTLATPIGSISGGISITPTSPLSPITPNAASGFRSPITMNTLASKIDFHDVADRNDATEPKQISNSGFGGRGMSRSRSISSQTQQTFFQLNQTPEHVHASRHEITTTASSMAETQSYSSNGGQMQPFPTNGGQMEPFHNNGAQMHPYPTNGGQMEPFHNDGGQMQPFPGNQSGTFPGNATRMKLHQGHGTISGSSRVKHLHGLGSQWEEAV